MAAPESNADTIGSKMLGAGSDPNPSVEILQSGPTLSYWFPAFRFYEAAVRDLRQPASSRRSGSPQNFGLGGTIRPD